MEHTMGMGGERGYCSRGFECAGRGRREKEKDSPFFYSLGSRSEQIRERRIEKVDNLPPAIERPWRRDASLHKFNLRPRFFCQPRRKGCGLEGDRSHKMRPPPPPPSSPHSPFPFKRKEDRRKMPVARASLLPVFLWTPRRLVFGCAHVCVHCPVQYARCTTYVYTILPPSLKTPQQESFCSVARAPSPLPPSSSKSGGEISTTPTFFSAVKEDHVRTPPRLLPPPYPLSSRYRAGIFVFFLFLRRRWDHWASMRGRRIPHKTRARSTDKPPTSKQSFPLLSPSFLPPIQQ